MDQMALPAHAPVPHPPPLPSPWHASVCSPSRRTSAVGAITRGFVQCLPLAPGHTKCLMSAEAGAPPKHMGVTHGCTLVSTLHSHRPGLLSFPSVPSGIRTVTLEDRGDLISTVRRETEDLGFRNWPWLLGV